MKKFDRNYRGLTPRQEATRALHARVEFIQKCRKIPYGEALEIARARFPQTTQEAYGPRRTGE